MAVWIFVLANLGFAEMTDQELERKALRIQTILEEHTLQEHGMLPMFVRASDYQLPTAKDYAGAYRHRHLHGKTEYLCEIERLYAGCGLDNIPRGGGGRSTRDLYMPSLMMELDPWRHQIWRPMMLGSWRNAKGSIQPDGTQLVSFSRSLGPHRTGRSAQWARGMVSAQRWFPNEPMAQTAHHILEDLDIDTFRFVMAPEEGKTLPPEWKVEGELIDHSSLVPWLLAYWEGRYYEYW